MHAKLKPSGRRGTDRAAATQGSELSLAPAVTVVGAGTMGSAMAARLLDRGMNVAVWSRHAESNRDLLERGAVVFADVTAAVTKADVVITMLPTVDVTRTVMLGGGALAGMTSGAIWVQMGTIGVSETEQLQVDAGRVRPDIIFIDAPVSGSRLPAENGQLQILASGSDAAASTLEPVFDALGTSTLWLGPVGAGSRMKLVLNTWLSFQIEAAAEAAALVERFGLDSEDLVRALHGNPLASDYAVAKLNRMLAHDYNVEFSLEWALKDLDLVASEAPDVAPIAGDIAERWRALVRGGWGDFDVSAARNGLGSSPTIRDEDGTQG